MKTTIGIVRRVMREYDAVYGVGAAARELQKGLLCAIGLYVLATGIAAIGGGV